MARYRENLTLPLKQVTNSLVVVVAAAAVVFTVAGIAFIHSSIQALSMVQPFFFTKN
jgi:hypothetical protein